MSDPARKSLEDDPFGDIDFSADAFEDELAGQESAAVLGADGGPAQQPLDDLPPIDMPPPAEEDPFSPRGQLAVYDDSEPVADEEALPYGASEDRPIPRISIQAFCESAELSVLLEEAAADRRLCKAHVTIQMGGIPKAVEQFQETATPNLIIAETLSGRNEILSQLEGLAQVCDPSTKVIVVGGVNDIHLYRELMRQGVSEYLFRPHSPLQIIYSIAGLYVDPEAPPVGRAIAFMGARGGVGSSTLAHNIGWCLAELQALDTTIIDLDLAFGTAGLDFNQDPAQGVADALSAPERLDDVLLDRLLAKVTDHLSLFAAPGALDRDYDFDEPAVEAVVDVVRTSSLFAVLDLPHIWAPWTKRLVLTADHVVITAGADLASLRNTKNLIDLVTAARPNDKPPSIILNQTGAPKRPEIPVKDFAQAIGAEPSLVVGWEPNLFGNAANNAQMVVDGAPKHKVSDGLRQFARELSGREEQKSKGGSFWASLLGKA